MMAKIETSVRQIDNYFNYYNNQALTLNSKIINGICAMCLYFSFLGFSWSLPFPYLGFLGQYNSYFNWASFVIAFSIYYYSKLSPLLSYAMLFLTLIFTYIISILQTHYINNSLFLGQIYFIILFAFIVIRYATQKMAGKRSTLKMQLLFILIGPVWVIHFLLKKFSIKY